MSYFQLPRLNQTVVWTSRQPTSVLRFGPQGGLVLLHATADPQLTAKAWQTQPLQLGLFGLTQTPGQPECPPVLCARLGKQPALAAPACLLELADDADIYDWLNARAPMPDLRLVLVRLSADYPGEGVIEASRRIWAPEWAEGDRRLRLRLEQQCLTEEPAPEVQHAGRELVATVPAQRLLSAADYSFTVDAQSARSLSFQPATELLVHRSLN